MKKLYLTTLLLLIFATPHFPNDVECGTPFNQKRVEKIIDDIPDDGRTFVFRVFFHVLYNTDEENVSNRNILDMLDTLQQDFMGKNPDLEDVAQEFRNRIGNPKIRFVLADTLPDGTPTTGIKRTKTDWLEFKLKDNKMFSESKIYDPTKYLNVYICDVNTNGYYPSSTSGNLDGIVVDYQLAKQRFRTITHETGHWLNLYHISGRKSGSSCSDDGVPDTPKQKLHTSCSRSKHPLFECSGREPVMFMNFMDYGEARYFFSTGQVTRMRQYVLARKNPYPED